MRRVVVSAVLCVALLLAGASIARWLIASRTEPPRRELDVLPPLVETLVIHRENYTEQFVGYATARADRAAMLAAEIAAMVIERGDDIEAGAIVHEGQVLIGLDDRQYRRSLERVAALAAAEQARIDELEVERTNLATLLKTAETELRLAADERTRVGDLFEQDNAHRREYDFAKLAYQRARRVVQAFEKDIALIAPRITQAEAAKRGREAEAALAQLDIERCAIRAPFAAAIQEVYVDVGDRVGPGSAILSIVDASRVEVPIQLPSSASGRVVVGARCRVDREHSTGPSWEGVVARIAPAADAATRTFAVYIEVDNSGRQVALMPGTFVRALVDGRRHEAALLVPRGAIRDDHLLVIEDGAAHQRLVVVDGVQFEMARVHGAVADGDMVVLSHLDVLVDGSPVRALQAASGAAATADRIDPASPPTGAASP